MFEAKLIFNKNWGFGVGNFVRVSQTYETQDRMGIKHDKKPFEGVILAEYERYFLGEKFRDGKCTGIKFTIHKSDLYTGRTIVKKLGGERIAV